MLSVVVLAKDEEARIKACLESVKWADELVVLDNGSTDGTLKIAKEYTSKIVSFKENDFAGMRNRAMEEVKGDWVLYVDADERVLEPLKEEILQITQNSNSAAAYALSRKNIIFGQLVDYGPYQNDRMIRLLKKETFKTWVGKVHEHATFTGDLGYTKNSLVHLTHRDLDHFILKSLEWSKIDAKLRFDSNHPRMTKWRFLRILMTEFFHQLIQRKGLFGGTVGIIDSVLQVFFFYMTYVRLWQMQQPKPLDQVYDEIDQELIKNDFKERVL